MIHISVTTVFAAALLGAGITAWLTDAGYSRVVAALIAAMMLALAGPLIAITTGQSLWLALGVLAVTASAVAFAMHADARRIILFGSSLAIIQLLDPLGGIVVAGLLPATLAVGRNHVARRQMTGLYVLLMFMPLTMAMFLLYLTRIQHVDPMGLLAGLSTHASARTHVLHTGLLRRLVPAAGFSLIVSPSLFGLRRRHDASALVILLVAAGIAVAAVVGAFLGAIRGTIPLLAAAAPIVVAAIAQWPASPARSREAVTTALLCMAVSWAVVVALAPETFAGG